MGRTICLLWIVTGCYSATAVEGLPCSETMHCPVGQSCDSETLTCYAAPPGQLSLVTMAAGRNHTCGLDSGGELWCWGNNQAGQLGLGDRIDRGIAARVETAHWDAISAGGNATCGIHDSQLWCWGDDVVIGAQSNRPAMVTTTPVMTWRSVSVGTNGFCAVATDHSTWCRSTSAALTMVDNSLQADTVYYSDGRQCVLAGQKLYCWGANSSGQVGNTTTTPVLTPYQLTGDWIKVAVGGEHTCAISADRKQLSCWGECTPYQRFGVTQRGAMACPIPTPVSATDKFIDVAANRNETCALRDDHAIVCFGDNGAGQLGTSTIEPYSNDPVVVSGTHIWETLAVGSHHACGITTDRNAWCWGYERFGNLGDGNTAFAQAPMQVDTEHYLSVSAGDTTTCAIRADNTAWCWGNNGAGQLGDGSTMRRPTPRKVDNNTDWLAISAGTNHTCGLRGTGTQGAMYCWGSNREGQAGLGSVVGDTQLVPKQVGSATDWVEVQAGTFESCGIRKNSASTEGGLWCWGKTQILTLVHIDINNDWRSLTLHAKPSANFQVAYAIRGSEQYAVAGLVTSGAVLERRMDLSMNFVAVTVGEYHGCLLDTNKIVKCWGTNDFGQLGVPTTTSMSNEDQTFAEQLGFKWAMVDAGTYNTCAITDTTQTPGSELYCWGSGDLIGSTTMSTFNDVPINVSPGTKWSAVSVGHRHVCGIHVDGTLWCWGENLQGELGAGFLGTNRPIRVHPGVP